MGVKCSCYILTSNCVYTLTCTHIHCPSTVYDCYNCIWEWVKCPCYIVTSKCVHKLTRTHIHGSSTLSTQLSSFQAWEWSDEVGMKYSCYVVTSRMTERGDSDGHGKKQMFNFFFGFSILLVLIMCMSALINCCGATVMGFDYINYTMWHFVHGIK